MVQNRSKNFNMSKKVILKKVAQIGSTTFLSRLLGIAREALLARFLGVGIISDAFLMAFKIPSFLRRIFAEGALASASVPVFVRKLKEERKNEASSLFTLLFLFFEGLVFLLTLFVLFKTRTVVLLVAPGFSDAQVAQTIPFLQILFPLLFFVSSSALIASVLQSVNHFLIPALGPVFLNIALVSTLLLGIYLKFNPLWLGVGVLAGGLFMLIAHLILFKWYGFKFGAPSRIVWKDFVTILFNFLFCLVGIGIVEINLMVDAIISSYLLPGSVTILHYGGRFMNIPLGIFAVSFSNVLLSQFYLVDNSVVSILFQLQLDLKYDDSLDLL